MAPAPEERLIIFARYPLPGACKTRLIPLLGVDGCADLQRALVEHIVNVGFQFASLKGPLSTQVEMKYEGKGKRFVQAWLGTGFERLTNPIDLLCQQQSQGALGYRMLNAVRSAFKDGAERVVLVGNDIPGIGATELSLAFESLKGSELVYGPAQDGGYYLVGLNKKCLDGEAWEAVFADSIPWGSATVLETSLCIARQHQIPVHVLPQHLPDVDEAGDFHVVEEHLGLTAEDFVIPFLSIIVPALNEEAVIADTLEAVVRCLHHPARAEVLVVDAGSGDRTVALVREAANQAAMRGLSIEVLQSSRGRSVQQQLGASRAKGQLLMFLHADSIVPEGFDTLIRACLQQNAHIAAGAFAFQLDIPADLSWLKKISLRAIVRGTNVRSRVLQLPYGDQGLFMRKALFMQVGGFADLPLMEDFELVDRLRTYGGFPHHERLAKARSVPKLPWGVPRIATLAAPVVTSARRWLERGVWWTTLLNQVIVAGWYLGASPTFLACLYRGSFPFLPLRLPFWTSSD